MEIYKVVNGKVVELTQSEIDARLAEDREWEACKVNRRVDQVKEIARSKILAVMPEYKQRNASLRLAELNQQESLSVDEITERSAILEKWSMIKKIRAHSNFLESELAANVDYDIDSGWPV